MKSFFFNNQVAERDRQLKARDKEILHLKAKVTRLASKDKAFRVFNHHSPVLGRRKLSNGSTVKCFHCPETQNGTKHSDHELCTVQQEVPARRHDNIPSHKSSDGQRHEHIDSCLMSPEHTGKQKCCCRYLRHSVSTPDVFADKRGGLVSNAHKSSNPYGSSVSTVNLNGDYSRPTYPRRRTFSEKQTSPGSEAWQNNGISSESCIQTCENRIKSATTSACVLAQPDEQDMKVIENLLQIEAACLSDTSMNSSDNSDED